MWMLSKYWDLPFYFVVPFITERLKSETDFRGEAWNAETMAKCVASDPTLRDRVYIPKTYPELNKKRVMVAEWIDGTRLWDRDTIEGPWKGKDMVGKELKSGRNTKKSSSVQPAGSDGTGIFNPPPPETPEGLQRSQKAKKPTKAGLGLSMKDVMGTMVDLFSAQMFMFGHVHCDPHPGMYYLLLFLPHC